MEERLRSVDGHEGTIAQAWLDCHEGRKVFAVYPSRSEGWSDRNGTLMDAVFQEVSTGNESGWSDATPTLEPQMMQDFLVQTKWSGTDDERDDHYSQGVRGYAERVYDYFLMSRGVINAIHKVEILAECPVRAAQGMREGRTAHQGVGTQETASLQ